MGDHLKPTVKGWLAALGQDVHPDARVQAVELPPQGSPGSVIVLERVRKGEKPEYCVHGYASCINCRKLCWLGHETEKIVSSGEAWAMCSQCAAELLPRSNATLVTHVQDHLRKDGPH